MFRPEDLEEISFERTFMGGYKLEEVEDFVNKISSDFISLYNENEELKKKLKIVVEKIEGYRSKENLISEALLHAQSLKESAIVEADKIIQKAKDESAIIIKAAEDESKRIYEAARGEVDSQIEKLKEDIQHETDKLNAIKKEVSDFKGKIQELYKAHLTSIMNIPNYDGPALEMKKDIENTAPSEETAEIHEKVSAAPEVSEAAKKPTEAVREEPETENDEDSAPPSTLIFEPTDESEVKENAATGKTVVPEEDNKPEKTEKPEQQTIFKKSLSGIFDFDDDDDKDEGGNDSFSFVLNRKK